MCVSAYDSSALYTCSAPPQRFNLTIDTNTQGSVLFRKGFVATKFPCGTGDALRNLFDERYNRAMDTVLFTPCLSLSGTYDVTDGDVVENGGYELDAYPYVAVSVR